MPGWELIDNKEKKAINNLFKFPKVGIKKPIFYNNLKVKEFEYKFAKYVNSKYAICVTSGTAAIKIALLAAGVKPNDEVITQSFTFIAVIEAIVDVGAIPVVTEVDETLNMCPKDLNKKITKKTKAILPVHMLGVSAEIDKIKKIASRKNIVVIDDNCEALGSKWKGKTLGNQFDMCAWSFYSGKTITTGEGGMITTNQKKFYKFCLEYRDHGHENNPKYPRGRDTHSIYGFNYRVSEIVGALGLVQLQKLDTVVKNNKNRYKIYEDVLKKYSSLKLRKIPKNNVPLKDCIIFNLKNKTIANKVLLEIKKKNIVTKNLPDAIEWHFAKYWDHIFKRYKITKRQLLNNFPKSSDYLERSIAIFIYTTEKLSEVRKKAKILDNILKLSLNEKKI
jgi:8-amino-3,8-dideoxy-alpha-D-manno-octulosonate transaminase